MKTKPFATGSPALAHSVESKVTDLGMINTTTTGAPGHGTDAKTG